MAKQIAHAAVQAVQAAPVAPSIPVEEVVHQGINLDALFPYAMFTALALVYVFFVRPQLHDFRLTAGLYGIIDSAESTLWQRMKARFASQWAYLVGLIGIGISIAPDVFTQLHLIDFSLIFPPAVAIRVSGVVSLVALAVIPISNAFAAKLGAASAGQFFPASPLPAPAPTEAPLPEPAPEVLPEPVAPDVRDTIVASLGDIAAQVQALSAIASGALPATAVQKAAPPAELVLDVKGFLGEPRGAG